MVRIHHFFLRHIHWATFSTQKRWILGGVVRIHDFYILDSPVHIFNSTTEGLGGIVRIHDIFLRHIHWATFSTQKRRNVGGMVRIHDFFYSGFTGSHFQLKNGGFYAVWCEFTTFTFYTKRCAPFLRPSTFTRSYTFFIPKTALLDVVRDQKWAGTCESWLE